MSATLWVCHERVAGKPPAGWTEQVAIRGPLASPTQWPPSGGEGSPPAEGEFWSDLAELNRRLGARAEALDLLSKVARGDADVIITGQQPGLLGGPVFNYLKLATILGLAQRWTASSGRPVLPLFWGVTDDSDYGEVSWTLFPDHELSLRKIRPRQEPASTRTMVGSLSRDFWEDALVQIQEFPTSRRGAIRDSAWLQEVRALPGEDWGELFLSLLLKLAGRRPLIVVDGRRPALLDKADPLFRRYLERREAVVQAVEGSPGRGASGQPSLSVDAARAALFVVEKSERLPYEGQEGRLSPNVVLRPLLQGFLFPQRGVVLGLGEIRYRLELQEVYRILELTPPAMIPRFSATILPPFVSQLPGEMNPAEWLLDPAKARSLLERSQREEDLRRLLEELQGALRAALGALSEIGSNEDTSYPQMVSSAERKILFQIRRLEEGLRAKIRGRWFKEVPGLARLEDFLRPRGQLQERGLNVLALGHLYGADAYGELIRWVEEWVDAWVGPEGDWSHWILGPSRRERGGPSASVPVSGQ